MAILSKGLAELFAQYYTDDLLGSLIENNKFQEFKNLFDKLDSLSKQYDSLLTQLETDRKGSKTKFLERLFGKVFRGEYDPESHSYGIKQRSGFLSLGSPNAAKNLAYSLKSTTGNELLESKLNEVYKQLMDTFLTSLDTLMEFTQNIRGTESFQYLIAGVTKSKGVDQLNYLAQLDIKSMHELFSQTNAFAIQHDPRSGQLVFKLNEGITSNQLLKLMSDKAQILQGEEFSRNQQIFNLLRGKVKAENETYIGSDRLIELIRNPALVDQLINFNQNGEMVINEDKLKDFRFHEDTVSLLTGSDIMEQGELGFLETSVKTLRSTIGFNITSIDQILNALFTLSSEQNFLTAINVGINGGNLQTALADSSYAQVYEDKLEQGKDEFGEAAAQMMNSFGPSVQATYG